VSAVTLTLYTYLAIDLLSLAGPLAYGFTVHSGFNRKWRAFLPALTVTALFFALWDIAFTQLGVWSFNPRFHLGLTGFGLPLEEWLFFFCIPFACLFLYDIAGRFPKYHLGDALTRPLSGLMGLGSLYVSVTHLEQAYTVSAFAVGSLACFTLAFGWFRGSCGHFLLAYLLTLIPFFLVNGLLTALPVVQYNDAENLGIRLFTIPIEDTVYSFGLLLLNVFLYEIGNPLVHKKS
jgi:lycopene cyclase domain-containing protein